MIVAVSLVSFLHFTKVIERCTVVQWLSVWLNTEYFWYQASTDALRCIHEQDILSSALYYFNPGRPIPTWLSLSIYCPVFLSPSQLTNSGQPSTQHVLQRGPIVVATWQLVSSTYSKKRWAAVCFEYIPPWYCLITALLFKFNNNDLHHSLLLSQIGETAK